MGNNISTKVFGFYSKNQGTINWVLFEILVLVSIFYTLQTYNFHDQSGKFIQVLNHDGTKILQLSTIAINVTSIIAIALAGAWSYYAFIRGRTFKPRLMIDINLKDFCGQNNDVAIITFSVTNIGKIKVSPLLGCATFQYGYLSDGEIKFRNVGWVEDLFEHYYEIDNNLFLEPDSKVNIDCSIVCSTIRDSAAEHSNGVHMLMVKSEFLAAKNRGYQEITLLNIEPKKEVKI